MEGPRDPKIYRAPDLDVFPPKLQDIVGVFSGYRVKIKKNDGDTLMIMERGSSKYLMIV